MNGINTTGMVIETTAGQLPLVAGPDRLAKLLGKSGRAVRDDCDAGRIPTLPRGGGSGSWYRVPVAKLLDDLGVQYEIVPAKEPEALAAC